jgi:hypothetical protein
MVDEQIEVMWTYRWKMMTFGQTDRILVNRQMEDRWTDRWKIERQACGQTD